MEKIKIGKIVNAVGLKGEVKVYSYAQNPERFEKIDTIFAGSEEMMIENVRYQKNMVILKLKGIDDRNASESLKGQDLFIPEDSLEELPDGEYYIKDLIGIDVFDMDMKKIGTVKDILKNTAQDMYEIKMNEGHMAYVPGVPEFIDEINVHDKYIRIDPPKGLLDINRK